MIIDAFMINDELDMIECRLTEIADVVDVVVAVEADVDHQNHPKEFVLSSNLDRFEQWWDKLLVVPVTGLPTDPDPWSREHAQREFMWDAIEGLPGIKGTDVVLQSDVDEIPRAMHVRNVRPGNGLVVFKQRMHPFAVDWRHPVQWQGTVAGTVESIRRLGDNRMTRMRDARLYGPTPSGFEDAGWHFTWVGQDPIAKANTFCHPEVYDHVVAGGDRFLVEGEHVDGFKLKPVDVDRSWPKWIRDGHAPKSWFRPRPI